MEPKTIVFFSYPCGGKDSHSEATINLFRKRSEPCLYVNTGELLRNLKKSDAKNKLNKAIEKGSLVLDSIVESMVGNYLLNKLTKKKHLILNGFPRDSKQAEFFLELMNFFERKVDIVFIDITQKEAQKRIKNRKEKNRCDDSTKSLKKRFKIFRKKELSLIPFFKTHFTLTVIDGNASKEIVHQRILSALKL
jgi:adenylate kinase family enzyme